MTTLPDHPSRGHPGLARPSRRAHLPSEPRLARCVPHHLAGLFSLALLRHHRTAFALLPHTPGCELAKFRREERWLAQLEERVDAKISWQTMAVG